jgi:hypothetical protein
MTTQLDCSLGLKKETTYGTFAVPDQFLEFTSESLDANLEFTQGAGMRVGSRVDRGGRRVLAKTAPAGSISLEAASSGLGALLEAAFGAVTNTEVPTSTGVYQQVHTPKTSDYLDSFTIQKGIPPLGGGATHALSFLGAMCDSIEFSASDGGLLMVSTAWKAQDIVTDESYAAPSYPATLDLFHFVHGKIYVGNTITKATDTALASAAGSELANIRAFSLKCENGLDDAGFNLGGAGKRTRKNALGKAAISGSMTAEYDAATLRDAYLNNTDLTLLLTFTLPDAIATDIYPVLQIHVPLIKLEGELPKANGGDVITQTIPFTGLDSLAASTEPIYVVYRTEDTTP